MTVRLTGAVVVSILRAMKAAALRVSDITSKRLLIRVSNGNGRRQRYVILSLRLLEALRDWYRIARPLESQSAQLAEALLTVTSTDLIG